MSFEATMIDKNNKLMEDKGLLKKTLSYFESLLVFFFFDFVLFSFFVVFKTIFMLIVICGCIIYRVNTYGLLLVQRFEIFSMQFFFLQHSKDEMGIFMVFKPKHVISLFCFVLFCFHHIVFNKLKLYILSI